MELSTKHYVDSSHYQKLAERASAICVDANVTRYPVNPVRLAGRFGVKVASYERFCRLSGNTLEELMEISPDGFCIFKDGAPVVAYNPKVQSKGRRRWTLLHELSHVLLGHISGARPQLRSLPDAERHWLETDADDLTSCLIAPLGVAHLCNVQSVPEMQAVFGLSRQCAGYFYRDLNGLRMSGRIHTLLFPESLALCLPFISDRLVIQHRLKAGMLHGTPCLDIPCDEVCSL